MKIKNSLILGLSSLILATAQGDPAPKQIPPPAPPGAGSEGKDFHGPPPPPGERGPLANLSPEEREKLKAARQQALKDPKVEEALKNKRAADEEFQKTLHDAMLAADPSLEAILKKVEEARKEKPPGPQRGPKPPPPPQGEGSPN